MCVLAASARAAGSSVLRVVAHAVALVAGSAAGALLLEAGTIFGTPQASVFQAWRWDANRMAFFFVVCLVAATFVYRVWGPCGSLARKAEDSVDARKRPLPLRLGGLSLFCLTAALVALALAVTGAWHWTYHGTDSRLAYLVLSMAIIVGVLVWVRQELDAHLEYVVLVIAVVLGSYLCFAEPPLTAIGPDDQIHFDYSLGLSYFGGDGVATVPTTSCARCRG